MINLLPPDQDKTFWNPNTTFLDIYCKSGVFLEILYRRLMGVLANFPGYEDEQVRSSHILNNQLFGLSPLDDGGLMLATRRVYGDIFHKNLIHYDIQNVMKDISSRAGKNFELYEQNLVNTLKQVTNKEFNKMNFNVVIGNPPYNRGGDIDFVNLSYEIQTDFVVMITPAKWQTAEADQKIASKMSYGQFRKKLVPHMREVVFYPDSFDLFRAAIADGVTYFILDVEKTFDVCNVKNRCAIQKRLNSVLDRTLTNGDTLWNIGYQCLGCLGQYKKMQFDDLKIHKAFKVSANKQLSVGGMGYRVQEQDSNGHWVLKDDIIGKGGPLLQPDGNTYALGKTGIMRDSQSGVSGTSFDVFRSDSINECKQFKSYIETKFIRFILLVNNAGLSSFGNLQIWEKAPIPMVLDEQGNRVPGKFDHMYTDEELYKTWNLPQKYIDVIEAVIKERK